MELNEYQRHAMKTEEPGRCVTTRIRIAALGLCGEAGEVADHIKKVEGHGHTLDAKYIIKELGDILWYVSQMADVFGVDLETVAFENIKKLQARYPDGFSAEASIKRKD